MVETHTITGEAKMLKHEWYHLLILRFALEVLELDGIGGRSTTWGALTNFIRATGLAEDGVKAALLLLNERSLMGLKKVEGQHGRLGYLVFDCADYLRSNEFFWGHFRLCVTAEGAAYLNELEAKAHMMVQATVVTRPRQIGFQA